MCKELYPKEMIKYDFQPHWSNKCKLTLTYNFSIKKARLFFKKEMITLQEGRGRSGDRDM